jgi:hypothetical protein
MFRSFRRPLRTYTWHFCSKCTHWPVEGEYESSTMVESEHICLECLAKCAQDETALETESERPSRRKPVAVWRPLKANNGHALRQMIL